MKRAAAFLVAAVCVAALTGCSALDDLPGLGTAGGSTNSSTPAGSVQDTITLHDGLADPGPVVVVCLDESGSYGRANFQIARNAVADALVELVVDGRAGAWVQVRTIGTNSRDPATALLLPPFTLPTVPRAQGQVQAPSDPKNPILAKRHERRMAAVARAVTRRREEALATARAKGDELRAVAYRGAPRTDLGGCVAAAADAFAKRTAGRHLLVVASDLVEDVRRGGSNWPNGPVLAGATVRAVAVPCARTIACEAAKQTFRNRLATLGDPVVELYEIDSPMTIFADAPPV